MKKFLWIVFLVSLISCSGSNHKTDVITTRDSSKVSSKLGKIELIDSLVGSLDSDSIEQINQRILKIFRSCQDKDLLALQSSDFAKVDHHFGFCISDDKKLAIISWNTMMGGTMRDYTSVIFVFNNKNANLVRINESSESEGFGCYYDTIVTIRSNEKENIYLCHGVGQASGSLPWEVLEANNIIDTLVKPTNIFPNLESSLLIDYDISDLKENEQLKWIEFSNNGLELLVPETTDEGYPTGKVKTLRFDGKEYK